MYLYLNKGLSLLESGLYLQCVSELVNQKKHFVWQPECFLWATISILWKFHQNPSFIFLSYLPKIDFKKIKTNRKKQKAWVEVSVCQQWMSARIRTSRDPGQTSLKFLHLTLSSPGCEMIFTWTQMVGGLRKRWNPECRNITDIITEG